MQPGVAWGIAFCAKVSTYALDDGARPALSHEHHLYFPHQSVEFWPPRLGCLLPEPGGKTLSRHAAVSLDPPARCHRICPDDRSGQVAARKTHHPGLYRMPEYPDTASIARRHHQVAVRCRRW